MKKTLIVLLLSLILGTILMAKVPDEIKKAYQIQKGKDTVVAIFKYTLKTTEKDTDKVTAIMIRGFDIAYEEAKEQNVIGAGVMFEDDTMEANYTTYEDLKAVKEGKMTPQEFGERIKIKRFNNVKNKKE